MLDPVNPRLLVDLIGDCSLLFQVFFITVLVSKVLQLVLVATLR